MKFSAESMWEGNGFQYYQEQSLHLAQQSQQHQYQYQQFIQQQYQQESEQQCYNYPLQQFLYQQQKYLSYQQQEYGQQSVHYDTEDAMITSLEKKLQENDGSEDISNFNVFGRLDESINLLELQNCRTDSITKQEKQQYSEEYQQYPSQACDISSQSTCYSQSSPQSSFKTIETPLTPRYIELFSGQGVHLSFFDCPLEQTEIDEILLFNGESVVIYTQFPGPQTTELNNVRIIFMKPGKQIVIRRALSDYNDTETITQFPLSTCTPGLLHFQAIDQEPFQEE